jgi:hypothetical protein
MCRPSKLETGTYFQILAHLRKEEMPCSLENWGSKDRGLEMHKMEIACDTQVKIQLRTLINHLEFFRTPMFNRL